MRVLYINLNHLVRASATASGQLIATDNSKTSQQSWKAVIALLWHRQNKLLTLSLFYNNFSHLLSLAWYKTLTPAKTTESVETAETAETAETDETADPAKPAETTETYETAETAKLISYKYPTPTYSILIIQYTSGNSLLTDGQTDGPTWVTIELLSQLKMISQEHILKFHLVVMIVNIRQDLKRD